MSRLAFMNADHLDHLLSMALDGDREAVHQIRQEWQLQRERIRVWREEGREINRDEWRRFVSTHTTGENDVRQRTQN